MSVLNLKWIVYVVCTCIPKSWYFENIQGNPSPWFLYSVAINLGSSPGLWAATAQAGQGNSPNWLQHNIGIKVTGHPVKANPDPLLILIFKDATVLGNTLGPLIGHCASLRGPAQWGGLNNRNMVWRNINNQRSDFPWGKWELHT